MPTIPTHSTIDPLAAIVTSRHASPDQRPIPLVATSFDVSIDSGLAVVQTKRVFRNDERFSIEATMTFPVPVHAMLFALEARIAGRVVKARAMQRKTAREQYEDAIERGKASVLHEEVLRGVHMLSVAHVAPGTEIEVTTAWATILTFAGDRGTLRIPLTVGHVYGCSGLPDSDALMTGGPVQKASLAVRTASGQVTLVGGQLVDGRAEVPMNAPIDLKVADATFGALRGVGASGREVTLQIAPIPSQDSKLDVAIVVDHSGSMGERCSGAAAALTKHQALMSALCKLAPQLGSSDAVDLWEFASLPKRIGSTNDKNAKVRARESPAVKLRTLVEGLQQPSGGTEIGRALSDVLRDSSVRDVLLITDGKSHALDVPKIAQLGRRISVVLIGEDSLEANVGHLAAMTGGTIVAAVGGDASDALQAAANFLRLPAETVEPISGLPQSVNALRGNCRVMAEWQQAEKARSDDLMPRAVVAVATGLALSGMDEDMAAQVAEEEGLTTHLTSLVLVDEASEAQEGVPAMRKVPLPTPRTAFHKEQFARLANPALGIHKQARVAERSILAALLPLTQIDSPDLASLIWRVDWDLAPAKLQSGDLSVLDEELAKEIRRAAGEPSVVALAQQLGISPVVLVIALMALAQSQSSRTAARIAKSVLGDPAPHECRSAGAKLNLVVP